jgi:hypothetical protein
MCTSERDWVRLTIVVPDALGFTALSILVAVKSCLQEQVEGGQDLHDGQHLPAGGNTHSTAQHSTAQHSMLLMQQLA